MAPLMQLGLFRTVQGLKVQRAAATPNQKLTALSPCYRKVLIPAPEWLGRHSRGDRNTADHLAPGATANVGQCRDRADHWGQISGTTLRCRALSIRIGLRVAACTRFRFEWSL
jgi:hypothetical protein